MKTYSLFHFKSSFYYSKFFVLDCVESQKRFRVIFLAEVISIKVTLKCFRKHCSKENVSRKNLKTIENNSIL